MIKEKHNEARKLFDNISKFADRELAEEIAYGADLLPAAGIDEKAKWVKHVSSELEKHFEEHTIKDIRMGCYCNENGKLDQSKEFIRKIYSASASLRDFVNKMNEHGAGWYIEEGNLYTKYDSCPCPMLEGVDLLPTKTWCYCTVGYNKHIFESVFEREVDVELIESIKIGNKQCLMRIIPRKSDLWPI
ncbi:MAG: hypothetical protein KBA53_03775 [Thermoclostridium sp.]|nr:hypothetical protein [Thermoclostridium sp.]